MSRRADKIARTRFMLNRFMGVTERCSAKDKAARAKHAKWLADEFTKAGIALVALSPKPTRGTKQ